MRKRKCAWFSRIKAAKEKARARTRTRARALTCRKSPRVYVSVIPARNVSDSFFSPRVTCRKWAAARRKGCSKPAQHLCGCCICVAACPCKHSICVPMSMQAWHLSCHNALAGALPLPPMPPAAAGLLDCSGCYLSIPTAPRMEPSRLFCGFSSQNLKIRPPLSMQRRERRKEKEKQGHQKERTQRQKGTRCACVACGLSYV